MIILLDLLGLFYPKHKSGIKQDLINFISYIDSQFSVKLKCSISDNGVEIFVSDFYILKGVVLYL